MIRIVSRLAGFLTFALAVVGLVATSTPASAAMMPTTQPVAPYVAVPAQSITMGSNLAPASTIQPQTARSCGTGSSSGNVTTCMYVNGAGLHINYARSSATVHNSGRTLQSCIRGPRGTVGCTPFKYVPVGYTLYLTWSPNSNEPAGNYCANTWRLNSNGSHTEIGHYCVNVHA